ncbi:MAG: hypothetical protein ISQ14_13265 [Verrucomicrobiae bacterium]|nr:hypothetical protein [Verrucomicrobiae bacterium]
MRNIRSICACLFIVAGFGASGAPEWSDLERPEHNYWERPLDDRFTRLKDDLEQGRLPLDYGSELAFLKSLLKALEIPESSQVMLFSTTSLQLRLITPSNPRAIYFNEDLYIGYIPGGRIEVVAMNPELGGVFYIFDIPRDRQQVRVERSNRCMNCHASEDTMHVPSLLVKSVIPGPNSGSLKAFRIGASGHAIPLAERFGGWHVTGGDGFEHQGNVTGRYVKGKIVTSANPPGYRFRWDRYPVKTSDILPHLLLEHQTGFANRVLKAGYKARAFLAADEGKLTSAQEAELEAEAEEVTRYLLFVDEVAFPEGGFVGDTVFKKDFRSNRRETSDGLSLKDFDLSRRLFAHRCSYMIYSPIFSGLHAEMKRRIYARLEAVLGAGQSVKGYESLTLPERMTIRRILVETLAGYPGGS